MSLHLRARARRARGVASRGSHAIMRVSTRGGRARVGRSGTGSAHRAASSRSTKTVEPTQARPWRPRGELNLVGARINQEHAGGDRQARPSSPACAWSRWSPGRRHTRGAAELAGILVVELEHGGCSRAERPRGSARSDAWQASRSGSYSSTKRNASRWSSSRRARGRRGPLEFSGGSAGAVPPSPRRGARGEACAAPSHSAELPRARTLPFVARDSVSVFRVFH